MANTISFDEQFYLQSNPDVAAAVSRGLVASGQAHYNNFGRFEARNPNAFFNTSFYLGQYPDVARAGVNPLTHFLTFGVNEARAANSTQLTAFDTDGNGFANEFNATAYLAANQDVARAVSAGTFTSAYQHFVQFGQFEGRPAPLANGTTVTGPFGNTGAGGSNFTLTAGADTFAGTSGNDTFTAAAVTSGGSVVSTLTAGDNLNGGAGNDTLRVVETNAFTGIPAGVTISNIETIDVTSGATVALNTSAISGVTNVVTNSTGGANVTAATTTAVSVTENALTAADGNVTVNGGSNVTLNVKGTVADGDAGAEIVVGGTTAPTGTVSVTSTFTGTTGTDQGDIAITGGTTVTVAQSLGNAVNTTNTHGTVTVTGGAATTSVSVTQDKAATASATVAGKVNGAVAITDVNAASGTAAGTIASVTLNSYGNSTIDSSALTSVTLSGTGGTLDIGRGALTATPTANTLALNVSGLTAGVITDAEAAADDGFQTLNITSSGTASTIGGLVAVDAKAINVAGDAKLTASASTLTSLESITVTNTGGFALAGAIGANATFTGGAGADAVELSTGFTKAITLGAGNDTLTYGGPAGTGGSVAAGEGIDTIVMSGAEANSTNGASADGVFNSKFSGFEILSIESGANAAVNLAGINGVNNVTTVGATSLTLNGYSSGGILTLTGDSTAVTANVTNASVSTSDVFNVNLSNSGSTAGAFGSVTAAGVETINISTIDAGTGTSTAATVDALTLVATSATKVVVTGNNGLDLTNTNNTAITSFDASGVVGNSADDTGANLGVTFASANTTTAVTIIGGAGNDTLTGNAGVDTITGGLGADRINGGGGNDIIILTEATPSADTVVISATADNGIDTIIGFSAGTAGLDIVEVRAAVTTAGTTSGAAVFAESTNTTLTNGASAFALTGAVTTTADVVEINATLSSFGNLGATGVVDGTELLKALSSVNVASSGITTSAANDDFYLVAYQNNNAYLYQVTNGADTNVVASEIALVGVFNGVAQGAFASGDFTVA